MLPLVTKLLRHGVLLTLISSLFLLLMAGPSFPSEVDLGTTLSEGLPLTALSTGHSSSTSGSSVLCFTFLHTAHHYLTYAVSFVFSFHLVNIKRAEICCCCSYLICILPCHPLGPKRISLTLTALRQEMWSECWKGNGNKKKSSPVGCKGLS